MDIFGIGDSLQERFGDYSRCARGTGRTTHLIESLADGDVVVVRNHVEGRCIQRYCDDAGVDVRTVIVNPEKPQEAERELCGIDVRGNVYFDHTWLEHYYRKAIERCINDVDFIKKTFSGRYGRNERLNSSHRRVPGPGRLHHGGQQYLIHHEQPHPTDLRGCAAGGA